ncbi:MAG: hypothetical protein AB1726_07805 [Planctomycetota bacterium]
MKEGTRNEGRRDLLLLASLFAVALAVRVGYVLVLDVPIFDPWRHLALIRNVREGAGFTLFAGQPYIWYASLWYRLCALFPASVGPEWIAAFFSALTVPLVALLAADPARKGGRAPAIVAAALTAFAGPMVAYTCHYGQEALALFLVVAALLLGRAPRGMGGALAAGFVFGAGVALRMNFAFLGLLFLPVLRTRRRALALALGLVLPLAILWFHNHRVIADHPFVFTWDGLATRSSDYGPLSTLVVQMHPAVQEGLSRLHEAIMPHPEWVRDQDGYHGDRIVFVATGLLCLVAGRRWSLLACGILTLGYFFFLDGSGSSRFFRLYLPLFPVFFLAVGEVVGRMRRSARRPVRLAAWGLAALPVVAGARLLDPPEMTPLDMLVPPAGTLTADHCLVNSGFYRPCCLIYRYPDVAFAGLPLDPAQFAAFHRAFPQYRFVLWNPMGSVQEDLFRHLATRSDFVTERSVRNAFGVPFHVLRER